jgi:hypothetical protein
MELNVKVSTQDILLQLKQQEGADGLVSLAKEALGMAMRSISDGKFSEDMTEQEISFFKKIRNAKAIISERGE